MREKKYIYILLTAILFFIIFHFITWNMITSKVFPEEKNIRAGDLGRMSYLIKSLTLRKDEENLPHKHITYNKEKIDVLTIGDSFSNGGSGGKNCYYQDYIASRQNLKVMNIQSHKKGFIETVLILNENGILDILKPRIIILESIERNAVPRYSKNINWNIGSKYHSTSFLNKKYIHPQPRPLFINNLNYNAILYPILYKFDDNAIFSKTYISHMSKELFSCEKKKRLLFYFEDLKSLSLSNQKSIDLLNTNLNKLQKVLDKKNIKLYFMPAVDKYNLYSKYIQKNNYPKSIFFEKLRPLDKDYTLIDTKMILRKMLEKNIIDLYYPDDTHWSYKASEEIFNQILF